MKVYGFFSDSYFKNKPGKWHLVIRQRSNPRTEEYMRSVFSRHFPEGVFTTRMSDIQDVERGYKVVLLYPDAIGLGFEKYERLAMQSSADIRVINGRGRFFTLTPLTRIRLSWKRMLESTFLPELVFAPLLAAAAIILATFDFMRGRA